MCQFKFCEGAHACFLKDSSPCPAAIQANSNTAPAQVAAQADRLRLCSKGFLDRDQLIAALGLEGHEPETREPARILRVASKLRYAAANMGSRLAS